MIIILPIYYTIVRKTKENKNILVWFNWYRNAHFQVSNEVKHHYHNLVADQVWCQVFQSIKPQYKIYLKSKACDYHNVRSVIEKFFLDWLVQNGNLPDDKYPFVIWDAWTEVYFDKTNPRIEIYI